MVLALHIPRVRLGIQQFTAAKHRYREPPQPHQHHAHGDTGVHDSTQRGIVPVSGQIGLGYWEGRGNQESALAGAKAHQPATVAQYPFTKLG